MVPVFNMFDVFCVAGDSPSNGENIDVSGATVLDPVAWDTFADTNGNPLANLGGTFNGETITQTGDIKTSYVDCDGAGPENAFLMNYITTDAGNTYYFPPDTMGDVEVAEFIALSVNSSKSNPIEGAVKDNNQEACAVAPCFTPDMPIETDKGPVRAGDLKAGDMVKTYDNGLQEVRYIYRRKVAATGENAPVLFKKGTIGNTADLLLSQKHRMYTGTLPEALKSQLKGGQDNLLHAVEFCNGTTVRLAPEVGEVEYIQIMFDNHELLFCNGTVSESWQPTASALKGAPEVADELLSIFPELDQRHAFMPGALARHEIKMASKAA